MRSVSSLSIYVSASVTAVSALVAIPTSVLAQSLSLSGLKDTMPRRPSMVERAMDDPTTILLGILVIVAVIFLINTGTIELT